MMALNMIVGSGGVLSHAPHRGQAALMMMDAYQPEGVTMLAVDSIFMMPQLGVLSTILPEAATQVFERDCLIKLGDCIAPVGIAKEGEPCVTLTMEKGEAISVKFGDLRLIDLGPGETDRVTIAPARGFDVGEGKGKARTVTVEGGAVGLIIDARGRPITLSPDPEPRIRKLTQWLTALNLPI
jgi:hypothetical protein